MLFARLPLILLLVATGASSWAQGDPPAVPASSQGCECPVLGCPLAGSAEFARLSLDEKARCAEEDWALHQIGWYRLQQIMPTTGKGVVLADIDTGFTLHPALPVTTLPDAPGILRAEGLNYQEGCPEMASCAPRDQNAHIDAFDPLRPAWVWVRQPGHGTGPPGVIITPGITMQGRPASCPGSTGPRTADRKLQGIAPGAQLVPIRVSNGVILSEGRSARVVKAVLGAALAADDPTAFTSGPRSGFHRVDVINISFGRRSPDEALEAAVALAERHGIIVVAATGEYPFWSPVRFPAQYSTVIGATGTRVNGRPWDGIFGAGRGPTAFVAAPGHMTWHPSTELVAGRQCFTANMGKGTSFSSPLVAGAAALWIEHWTKAALIAKYQRVGIPAAFRFVLWHSGYRTPEELCQLARAEGWANAGADDGKEGVCPHRHEAWDTNNWGRGILAVDKLLEAPLPSAKKVCAWVYEHWGEGDWDRACPVGSDGRDPELLVDPPAPMRRERITRLAGAGFGQPFGRDGGAGPYVDYGIIFSEHYYHVPRGLMLEGQVGAPTNVGVSVGYGIGINYDPFREGKQDVSVIPGFSPALAFAVKASYLNVHRDVGPRVSLLGPQIQLGVLKLKFGAGFLRELRTGGRWLWTWDAGFGF